MWGKFISFEGIDGSGKSSLVDGVYEALKSKYGPGSVVLTREPGGTPFAESLRDVVTSHLDREPFSELLVMLAARHENTRRVILPALRKGKLVLCDRYSDSTFAYQVFGKGLEYYTVSRLNKMASLGLKPHLTLLIDVDVDTALERLGDRDYFEAQGRDFLERVRYGYLALARRAKKRIKVLDGSKDMSDLLLEALGYIEALISR